MTRFALAGTLAGAVFVAAAMGFSHPAQSAEGERGIGEPGPAFTADYLCKPHAADDNIRSIQSFGAVGDGKADDYAAIRAGADWVSKNPGTDRLYLVYPPGTYKIDRVHSLDHPDGDADCTKLPAGQKYCYGAEIEYKKLPENLQEKLRNFTIQGCKATIALKGFDQPLDIVTGHDEETGKPTGYSSLSAVEPFRISHSSNFTVDGLEIYGGADKSSHEFFSGESGGVGIITSGCDHYQLSNLKIHHMQQDGVIVGTEFYNEPGRGEGDGIAGHLLWRLDTDFTLDHISSLHNARAALSVDYARRGTFRDLDLGYAGDISKEYFGFDPRIGVDIEPDLAPGYHEPPRNAYLPEKTGDLTFDHVNIHHNIGAIFSAAVGWGIENITIQNSHLIAGKGAHNGAAQVVMGVKDGLIKDSTIDLRDVRDDDGGRGEIWNYFLSKNESDPVSGKPIPNPDWSETSLTIQGTTVYTSGTGIQSLPGDGTYFGPLTIKDSHFIGSQPPDFLPVPSPVKPFFGNFPDLQENPVATISGTVFEYPAGWSNGATAAAPGVVGLLNIGSSTGNTFKSSFATPGVTTCIQYGATTATAVCDATTAVACDTFSSPSLQPCPAGAVASGVPARRPAIIPRPRIFPALPRHR